jgi:purine nucleosidase
MRQLVAITDAAPIGDDVVALAMLAHAREADFALAIATSGNVWAEEAATNVRRVLTHVGRDDIPVLIDRSRHPRLGPGRMQHESVGGANAVYRGALDHPRPPPQSVAQEHDDTWIDCLAALSRPDVLILGPARPLARLLIDRPELATHLGTVYVMGGAVACPGNATSAAEFNFWFDPEAAEILLAAGLDTVLLPLDAIASIRHSTVLADRLRDGSPIKESIRLSIAPERNLPICDEALVAIALDNSIAVAYDEMRLGVFVYPGPNYGSVHILDQSSRRKPVRVIRRIDEAGLRTTMERLLV